MHAELDVYQIMQRKLIKAARH